MSRLTSPNIAAFAAMASANVRTTMATNPGSSQGAGGGNEIARHGRLMSRPGAIALVVE
jgi:hypothetical protein